ncbi:plasmid stabilization protein [Epilithonimonas sp. JDS]|uniref:type II toxin-antitoxin system RelE family toxin n=1 Tax=Epilithonimonas sp. JDS TaxID=2902797 RepID=UPI001E2CD6A8|nr:plasmid stabilization protein [Epilithonimonas sp. JDS]MCD9854512.1 plasmid stabilization protein [Epilithonimonas sp. JDS]
MEVIFLRSFLADIKKLNDKKLKIKIKGFIEELENALTLEDVGNVKKMTGYTTAFRWRTGDYRLGFYKNENSIELARFLKRSDIYNVFPK